MLNIFLLRIELGRDNVRRANERLWRADARLTRESRENELTISITSFIYLLIYLTFSYLRIILEC